MHKPLPTRLSLAVLSLWLIAVALTVHAAKDPTVSLTGVVLNTKGEPVAAAQVFWQGADGKAPHELHTDAAGRFRMASLRPGLYDLRAEAGSMWSEWQHNVLIRAGSEVNVTLRLVRETPPAVVKVALKGVIREWVVPMGDDPRPQDPAVDPHGRIWMTLQNADLLARLDPQTGEWKFFSVPTQDAKPNGLVSDGDGNIWFTESGAGKIGRLDIATSGVTEFTVPEAKDPHTPAFGSDGALYFTSPNANLVVRLDPRSGATRSFPLPTPNAIPNTIALGPDGAMWFCEFGVNQLGRLDTAAGSVTEFAIPDDKERPRSMVVSGQSIYYTDFGGRLGRFDIPTQKFKSWPSPSGADSQPYGIGADSAGKIWYYETVPNQLVRFDPATEKFELFPMPTPKSGVVAMARDAHGRIWMPIPVTSKIAVIE